MNLVFKLVLLLGLAAPALAESLEVPPPALWGDAPHARPQCVRGIHLTSWYTGSKKGRKKFEPLFAETELNTAVIDVKEVNGEVYIPGTKLNGKHKVYIRAIRDLPQYLTYLKDRGVYTIARLTVFQDQVVPKKIPEWAVKSSSPLPKAVLNGFEPDIWVDNRGYAWADPFNEQVWDYNISIATHAAALGFQGIQFDYIRFPSDGKTRYCRYSKPKTNKAAIEAIAGFLRKSKKALDPFDVEISIDVFGLAGSYKGGLGIGQDLTKIVDSVDVVSPMMYPSHYGPGEYGIKNPNESPFEVVSRGVKDTLKVLEGTDVVLRPFLQDFSLGVKYTAERVRAQIDAARMHGVGEWLLWNPSCRYTRGALEETERY